MAHETQTKARVKALIERANTYKPNTAPVSGFELEELCRGYLANLETQEWIAAKVADMDTQSHNGRAEARLTYEKIGELVLRRLQGGQK